MICQRDLFCLFVECGITSLPTRWLWWSEFHLCCLSLSTLLTIRSPSLTTASTIQFLPRHQETERLSNSLSNLVLQQIANRMTVSGSHHSVREILTTSRRYPFWLPRRAGYSSRKFLNRTFHPEGRNPAWLYSPRRFFSPTGTQHPSLQLSYR